MVHSLLLGAFRLVQKDGQAICTPLYNIPVSFITYSRVYTTLFHLLPLVAMAILYCVIAMTLRRQDKALQCRAVHQKDPKKKKKKTESDKDEFLCYGWILHLLSSSTFYTSHMAIWHYSALFGLECYGLYDFFALVLINNQSSHLYSVCSKLPS